MQREQMLMGMAVLASHRGTCLRRRVGAVIAVHSRPLSIGYVGSAPGQPHCTDVGCLIGPDGGCIRTQHAEANAIAWAARTGLATEGASLYVTLSPCLPCAKLIVAAGIIHVYYREPYRRLDGLEYLINAQTSCTLCPGPELSELFSVRDREHCMSAR